MQGSGVQGAVGADLVIGLNRFRIAAQEIQGLCHHVARCVRPRAVPHLQRVAVAFQGAVVVALAKCQPRQVSTGPAHPWTSRCVAL